MCIKNIEIYVISMYDMKCDGTLGYLSGRQYFIAITLYLHSAN